MDCFFNVSSTILFFVTGDVLNYITFTETQIICMDVDDWLDSFVFVVTA
jgi:hypothetical protein